MRHARCMLNVRALLLAGTIGLLIAVGAATTGYVFAKPNLVRPGDEPFVERARRDATSILGEGWRYRETLPVVTRLSDRTCVEFRSFRPDEAGNYVVCYARNGGGKLEEMAGIGF